MKKLKKRNKRGLSTVVATLIMVLLVIVAVGIVWTFINNIIKKPIEESEACFGVFDAAEINSQYTCYNSTSNELHVSISVGNADVSKVLVSISSQGNSNSFDINSSFSSPNIRKLNGAYGASISVPGKNSGSTYVFNVNALGLSNPDSLKISPYIGGNQCGTSDSVNSFDDCLSLLG